MSQKTLVIVPTYNERDSIRASVELVVAERLISTAHSGRIGSPFDLRLDEGMDTGGSRRWFTPCQVNVLFLFGGQQ